MIFQVKCDVDDIIDVQDDLDNWFVVAIFCLVSPHSVPHNVLQVRLVCYVGTGDGCGQFSLAPEPGVSEVFVQPVESGL